MNAILERLQRLEDIEAIQRLKSKYLHACDQKRIAEIRSCFADGAITIDYGAIGNFQHRDDFLKIYQEKACHSHIIDIHHGHNFQIEWHSPTFAKGTADLFFHQIDTETGLLTQLGGYYQDEFRKIEDRWFITLTRFIVTSTLVQAVGSGTLTPLFQGNAPPPI